MYTSAHNTYFYMTYDVIIYTDGASRGNPGPGGWGAVVSFVGKTILEIGGREAKTTNNRMELKAVIESLKSVTDPTQTIIIYIDSKYVVNGATAWIHGWKKKDWKTKDGNPVLNRDLWEELDQVISNKHIEWVHLKGHAGFEANERCDEIATHFADEKPIELYNDSEKGYTFKVRILHDKELADAAAAGKDSRKGKKAYSYLSLVDGVLEKHKTWPECEERVKGKSGVKFRKAISAEDEQEILKEWGAK